MASIVQRKKSYSVVYIYRNEEGHRKQKWETYHTYKAALKRKLEIENPIEFLNQKTQVRTINDLLDEYVELHGQLHWSYSTYDNRVRWLDNYVRPFLGSVLFVQVDKHLLSHFFHVLKTNSALHISGNVLFEVYKLLHSVFEEAAHWGYFKENMVKHIRMRQPRYIRRDALLPEQIAIIINHAIEQNEYMMALMVHLAFSCSMRKGEIIGLCWDDINFDNGTISVSRELLRISKASLAAIGRDSMYAEFPSHQKRSKSVLVLKKPKTDASIRTVYVTPSLIQLLKIWKGKQNNADYQQPYQLVFTQTNGRPLCPKKCNEDFQNTALALGLPNVVFHSLRYSSTSYKLVLSGGNIKAVQGDNGHAQPDMVLSVYARINEKERRELVKQMEEEFCSQIRLE